MPWKDTKWTSSGPLIADEMRIRRPLGLDNMRLFARQMAYKWHSDSAYRPGPLPLTAVRRALIGERQACGFQEAAAKWHRYAATIAAMRDEQQTAKPGWPALCPDWRSACGRRYCVMANGSRRHRRPRRRGEGDRCPTVAMRPVRTP